jgi:hypothetical protein
MLAEDCFPAVAGVSLTEAPAGHKDFAAFLDATGHIFRHFSPNDYVVEFHALAVLAGRFVFPLFVGSHSKGEYLLLQTGTSIHYALCRVNNRFPRAA